MAYVDMLMRMRQGQKVRRNKNFAAGYAVCFPGLLGLDLVPRCLAALSSGTSWRHHGINSINNSPDSVHLQPLSNTVALAPVVACP